jgi:CIC family chloride channel protein
VRGHGIPEVAAAIKHDGEGLTARFGLVKLLGSALTQGSGGSTGREGPIVYGAGAIASSIGRSLGFTGRDLCILIACGSGAGIAASFNTPVAGAIFALEILLANLEARVFLAVIFASVSGTVVGQALLGTAPVLPKMDFFMKSPWEVLSYTALGLSLGVVSFAVVKLLSLSEKFWGGGNDNFLSKALGSLPLGVRAAIGGCMVGAMALVSPVTWGAGHDYVVLATDQTADPLRFLLVAFAMKVIATVVTLGSGGSGGLFFSSAVIGALYGGAIGHVFHYWMPDIFGRSGAYALVGMGGCVAAILKGPFTAMIIVRELTGDYGVIVPLMITCTISAGVCGYLRNRYMASGH